MHGAQEASNYIHLVSGESLFLIKLLSDIFNLAKIGHPALNLILFLFPQNVASSYW